VDGRRIGWRRLFRANRLNRLGNDELDRVADLGIVAVCDLRSAEEREMERSRWRRTPPIQLWSAKASNGEIREELMGGAPNEAEVITRMKAFYAGLPRRFADEYRALFEALASGQTPFLFHCTAGKDRTGVAAAILLDLLGASREQIVADYRLTDELLETERQARLDRSALGGDDRDIFASLTPAARLAVWRAHPDYIGAALESVIAEFGSSESYLEHLGLPIGSARRLQEQLLVREGEEHL
jgi:protein-tyrosine phosphatase